MLSWLPAAQAQSYNVDALSHAVVQVEVPDGAGSGTLVIQNNKAYVFTNRHVVENYHTATIAVLLDVTEPAVTLFNAELRGFSLNYDFAYLELTQYIENPEQPEPFQISRLKEGRYGFSLPALPLNAGLDVGRGENIAIFGYPGLLDSELVYTTGIIASLQYGTLNDQRIPMWYRTSAEMSPGNSGGLAVNSQGQFIGIPTNIAQEHETGGRLGNLLALPFALALMQDETEMTTDWALYRSTHDLELTPAAEPAYGVLSANNSALASGATTQITAGGNVLVNYLGEQCAGYAANAPDYRVNLSELQSVLSVQFEATNQGDDTTLIVQDPAGLWHCNDDFNQLNPALSIHDAEPGSYSIWVASYTEGNFYNGTLTLSNRELRNHSHNHSTIVEQVFTVDNSAQLTLEAEPRFGSSSLHHDIEPRQVRVASNAGGVVNMANQPMSECGGYAGAAANYSVSWQSNSKPLFMRFISNSASDDPMLYVLTPTGEWYCNDDANSETLQPELVLKTAPAGLYRIWVGTFQEGAELQGHLIISSEHQPLNQ
ncbi:S1 family peptidase [Aliidiomarina celeris]|uniref:S1 family peptidase n=1 Tax=Aliidiomarina celeris TaxID=2249428 RepID=UPI000DE9E1EC|nr:serine protease [Aliidiomarina celeris]